MRLSRTDLVPVLAIIAGGAIGASFTFVSLSERLQDAAAARRMSATADANSVLDRLEEVQRRQVPSPMEQLANDVEVARVRAADLAREQREVEADMERLGEAGSGAGSGAGRRLFERKEAMNEEVADLEREIDRLASDAREDQREASNRLREAATTIRDDKLKERFRYSRGLIGVQDREYTREFEAETTRIVEELQEELQRASDAALQALRDQSGDSLSASCAATDFESPLEDLIRCAEQGDAYLQHSLGLRHSLGRGVPQNDTEALRWFRLAAEQGDAFLQYDLGMRYDLGRGVPENDAEAIRWFRRAAEQGHRHAQYDLGVMYAIGGSISEDLVFASMWFNLSATQGDEIAQEHRDRIEQLMTREQIAEAQRLSREWIEAHP